MGQIFDARLLISIYRSLHCKFSLIRFEIRFLFFHSILFYRVFAYQKANETLIQRDEVNTPSTIFATLTFYDGEKRVTVIETSFVYFSVMIRSIIPIFCLYSKISEFSLRSRLITEIQLTQ